MLDSTGTTCTACIQVSCGTLRKGDRTDLSIRCSMVPSPSSGMSVRRISSTPFSSKNRLTACPIMFANLLDVPVGSPITLFVELALLSALDLRGILVDARV